MSRSWLSKLNNSKSYIPFIELFYKLLKPYINAHDYRVYSRYMRVLAIDSTFIKTLMNGSGSYKGESDGMKIHVHTIVFPFTVPLNAYISSANVNDSSLFDNILGDIDSKMLYSSILVFDLGYYNLERFKLLADKNILFVSRIKRNAIYSESGRVNGHEMVRMNNGLNLRIVRVNVEGVEYKYITDIMNLPDRYIYYAYNLRWNIEELFKRMKSQLKIDHLLSKSVNGMIIQAFSYMIAYIIVNMIMESIGIDLLHLISDSFSV
nr:IS4 family transposase [Ferroplasma sp.]